MIKIQTNKNKQYRIIDTACGDMPLIEGDWKPSLSEAITSWMHPSDPSDFKPEIWDIEEVPETILVLPLPSGKDIIEEAPRGLQVQPFDWTAWDDACEAKGICQGYTSANIPNEVRDADFLEVASGIHPQYTSIQELRYRSVDREGIAEPYWQCPHCRQLQKPIQWIEGARLESYEVQVRGNRTVIWVKVSSGAWFVLVTHGTLQGVAMGISEGTVYVVGGKTPLQLPDECVTILARRMWYRLTNGYWSDRTREGDDC